MNAPILVFSLIRSFGGVTSIARVDENGPLIWNAYKWKWKWKEKTSESSMTCECRHTTYNE